MMDYTVIFGTRGESQNSRWERGNSHLLSRLIVQAGLQDELDTDERTTTAHRGDWLYNGNISLGYAQQYVQLRKRLAWHIFRCFGEEGFPAGKWKLEFSVSICRRQFTELRLFPL